MDRKHMLVRGYHVSDAPLHDSLVVDHLLTQSNAGSGVWADAAYRSEEMETHELNFAVGTVANCLITLRMWVEFSKERVVNGLPL